MISLGNQQHAIIVCVSSVRDTMKSYFCFPTFCTLQSRHCQNFTSTRKEMSLDTSGLYDKTSQKLIAQSLFPTAPLFLPSSSVPPPPHLLFLISILCQWLCNSRCAVRLKIVCVCDLFSDVVIVLEIYDSS